MNQALQLLYQQAPDLIVCFIPVRGCHQNSGPTSACALWQEECASVEGGLGVPGQSCLLAYACWCGHSLQIDWSGDSDEQLGRVTRIEWLGRDAVQADHSNMTILICRCGRRCNNPAARQVFSEHSLRARPASGKLAPRFKWTTQKGPVCPQ